MRDQGRFQGYHPGPCLYCFLNLRPHFKTGNNVHLIPRVIETGLAKFEIRISKSETNSKSEIEKPNRSFQSAWDFVFRACFVFRYSNFGFSSRYFFLNLPNASLTALRTFSSESLAALFRASTTASSL